MITRLCPSCRHRLYRLQPSAPSGPAKRGPVAAVPCGCWLPHHVATAAAFGDLLTDLADRVDNRPAGPIAHLRHR